MTASSTTPIPAIPETPRDDVREILHGVEITDRYRWLEDGDSPAVSDWSDAQQRRTAAVLGAVPGRDRLAAQLDALSRIGSVSAPAIHENRLFFQRRSGEMDQAALYVRDTIDGDERVLIDPNTDADGLTTLDWWYPSADGALVAFGTSRDGDEWSTLQIVDVATGERHADRIERTRYSSIAWSPDGSGFYYTRYPALGSVAAGDENYYSRVYYHHLGDDPAGDPLVFGEGYPREIMVSVHLSEDGRWLVVVVQEGWVRSAVHVRDRQHIDGPWVRVTGEKDALYGDVEVHDGRLFLLTNDEAPNYRILAGDLPALADSGGIDGWSVAIGERSDRVIAGYTIAGGRIVTHETSRATSQLHRMALDGADDTVIDLPGPRTVAWLRGSATSPLAVFTYTSYATPAGAWLLDVVDGTIRPLTDPSPPAGIDLSRIVVEQVEYRSKDGTPVTMFLVGHEDVLKSRTGETPTILYGYGGFNIALTAAFNEQAIPWIERGGLFAVANLRGGSEYGETWHRAGMLGNKQNVFDDFIAAAEWLIGQGYTRPGRLAVQGGSNGGLLVGAFLTQAPDLCAAVNCGVPLLDMVRYHLFSIARLWVPEYGSSDDRDAFQWIHAYSPYHHVEAGRRYPAVLFTTADHDTRVDPLHARKMTALMQAEAANGHDDVAPILLRVETNAGHGIGKPRGKAIAEAVDELCFISRQLGVDLTAIPSTGTD